MQLDPVTIQILWNRLITIVDEAATGLMRTAYTPSVKEYHDFCCALFDANGCIHCEAVTSMSCSQQCRRDGGKIVPATPTAAPWNLIVRSESASNVAKANRGPANQNGRAGSVTAQQGDANIVVVELHIEAHLVSPIPRKGDDDGGAFQ